MFGRFLIFTCQHFVFGCGVKLSRPFLRRISRPLTALSPWAASTSLAASTAKPSNCWWVNTHVCAVDSSCVPRSHRVPQVRGAVCDCFLLADLSGDSPVSLPSNLCNSSHHWRTRKACLAAKASHLQKSRVQRDRETGN